MIVHFLYPTQSSCHGFVPKKLVNYPLAQSAAFLAANNVPIKIHGAPGHADKEINFDSCFCASDWVITPLIEGTSCAKTLNTATDLSIKTGARIVVTSHLASIATNEIIEAFPTVSNIIVGEDEASLYELVLGKKKNQPLVIQGQMLDQSLWEFPTHAHWGEYAALQTSRGCAHLCDFCSSNAITSSIVKPMWRGLPAAKIYEWLERSIDLGAKFVEIIDSDFLGSNAEGFDRAVILSSMSPLSRTRIMASTRADSVVRNPYLIKKLAEFGFVKWQIGVESADQQTLNRYSKGFSPEISMQAIDILLSLNISVRLEFIMFEPWSTFLTLRANLFFLRQLFAKGIFIRRALFNRLRIGRWSPSIFSILSKTGRLRRHIFPLYDYVDDDPDVACIFSTLRSIHTKSVGAALTLAELLERLLDLDAFTDRVAINRSLSNLDEMLLNMVEDVVNNKGRRDVPVITASLEHYISQWVKNASLWLIVPQADIAFPGISKIICRALQSINTAAVKVGVSS